MTILLRFILAALLALPYAYRSLEHMDEVASGEIGDQIEAEIIANADIRPLTYFARGPRNLTANRAITTPGSWWDAKAQGDAAAQGSEFHVEDRGYSVREAEDGKRVVWTVEPNEDETGWDDTSLIFDISEDDAGETKVNFTHRGLRPLDRGYDEIAKAWKDRIAKGLQPLIGREENP